jgi:excisionase family DNA binding protein
MNTILTHPPNILTPEQAAAYLQVDRETVYRYIRSGKLVASKLGRAYRIPKQSIELLLWVTRTRPDISLREYTGSEIDEFMSSDLLDDAAQTIVNQINHATRSQ